MGAGDLGRTVVVGADLESLITTHEKSDASSLLMFQDFNVTSSTLTPFLAGSIETIQTSTTRGS